MGRPRRGPVAALLLLATLGALAQGGAGNAVSLNGSNAFITSSLLITNPQEFTLALWFRTTSTNGGKLIGLGNSSNAASTLHDRALYLSPSGVLFGGVHDGTAVRSAADTNSLNDGQWHHAACTFSAGTGFRLYVDGALAATNGVTNAYAYNGYWRLGWDAGWLPQPQPFFHGQLDDAQVWNIARSPQEIAQTTLALTGDEPGLLEHWRCDDSGGASLADSVAANGFNTATLHGGAALVPSTRPSLPVLEMLPVSGVSATGATLNGAVNPNQQAAIWYYEFGPATNYGSYSPTNLLPVADAMFAASATLDGLAPNTPYHFRLVAGNASGVVHGTNSTFTTLPAPPVVVTLEATGVTNSTATLNGTAQPGGVPAIAWFEWGTASFAPTRQSAPVAIGPGSLPVPSSQAITGLAPGLTYFGRLVASNAGGLTRGAAVAFGAPALVFGDPVTNECHVAYVETAVATHVPLALAAGGSFSAALRADRRVASWGFGDYGVTSVPAAATNVVALASGPIVVVAARANGSVLAWGTHPGSPRNVPAAATNVVAVAAGDFHALALRGNGTVVAWGSNQQGQVTVPVSATNVASVAARLFHNLALRSNGTVVAWGDASFNLMIIPPQATNITAVACGAAFNLALRSDGVVVLWGSGPSVPPEATNVVAIAAGHNFAVALRRDGSVVAWGNNSFGQATVPAAATNIVALSAGSYHTLAMRADGVVLGWGGGTFGETTLPAGATDIPLSSGTTPNVDVPGSYVLNLAASNALGGRAFAPRTVVVADTLPPVVTVNGANPITNGLNAAYSDPSVSANDLCAGSSAVTRTGSVNISNAGDYVLTYTATDPAGNTGTNTRLVRVQALRPDAFTSTPSASSNAATLRSFVTPNGLATVAWVEWGAGTNPFANRTTAVAVGDSGRFLALTNVVTGIVPGQTYFCRAAASNALGVTYGRAEEFKVPVIALNGPVSITNECHFPLADPGAVNLDAIRQMVCGWNHVMILRYDGTVRAWGAGTNGTGIAPHYGQSAVPAGLSNIVAIDAGRWHSLAVRSNGTVAGWGFNGSGQINIPAAATNVIAVSGGDDHSLALRANGTVIGWGWNASGQTTIPPSATNITAISAGAAHSLALRADGTVLGWGANGSGEINIPASATNVMAIGAGEFHSLALRSNGTVIAWGNNGLGQTNVPFTATNLTAIAVGRSFNLALRANGTVVGWGYNGQGQLNFNPAISNVVMISAGDGHSHAVRDFGYIDNVGNPGYGENFTPSSLVLASVVHVEGSVDTDVPGTYTLSYSAGNSLGGSAQVTRTVLVRDTLPPSLTLNGPALVILTNDAPPWMDPGATATDLCAGTFPAVGQSNINFSAPGSYTATYVATDPSGNSVTNTRTVIIAYATLAPPAVPGDTNGDHVVSRDELAGVLAHLHGTGHITPADLSMILSNYWPASPWLLMTNVAGLGTPNVTFALPGAVEAPFRVEATTNLVDWEILGALTPRYEFLDTNAPAVPNRLYRLRWP